MYETAPPFPYPIRVHPLMRERKNKVDYKYTIKIEEHLFSTGFIFGNVTKETVFIFGNVTKKSAILFGFIT